MSLQLRSDDFSDGGEIPREFGYKNGNYSPSLIWTDWSERTETFALIMDDPDAMEPAGKVWVHWVFWNISTIKGVYDTQENRQKIKQFYKNNAKGMHIPNGKHLEELNRDFRHWTGATEGMTDFDEEGYGGPAPPDKRHTYVFKLYALDSKLELTSESTKADVEKAMEGHILEQATLTGTYAP